MLSHTHTSTAAVHTHRHRSRELHTQQTHSQLCVLRAAVCLPLPLSVLTPTSHMHAAHYSRVWCWREWSTALGSSNVTLRPLSSKPQCPEFSHASPPTHHHQHTHNTTHHGELSGVGVLLHHTHSPVRCCCSQTRICMAPRPVPPAAGCCLAAPHLLLLFEWGWQQAWELCGVRAGGGGGGQEGGGGPAEGLHAVLVVVVLVAAYTIVMSDGFLKLKMLWAD